MGDLDRTKYCETSLTVAVEFYGRQQGNLIVPRSDWNTVLTDSMGRPLGQFPKRAVDDAVAGVDLFYDVRSFERLNATRAERERLVRRHFEACASKFLDALEATEEWARFGLGRSHQE